MLAVMSSITALVLAAFVGYGGAWYIGMVEGNFALLLFLATEELEHLLLSAAAGCAGRFGFFERAYIDDRRPDLIDKVGEVRQRTGLCQSRLRRQDGSAQAQCHQGVQGQSAQGDSIQWKHHELSEKNKKKKSEF